MAKGEILSYDPFVLNKGEGGSVLMTSVELKLMADSEILTLVLEGRTEVYSEIFVRYRERAFALAFQYLRNREDAKDVVQEAFIKVYQNLEKFKLEKQFSAWLMTIVRNLSVDSLRKRRRQPGDSLPPALTDPLSLARVESGVRDEELWKALDKLSGEQKEIIFLKDYQGHSYREISEILEIPIGTVMSRLHYARKNLILVLRECKYALPRD